MRFEDTINHHPELTRIACLVTPSGRIEIWPSYGVPGSMFCHGFEDNYNIIRPHTLKAPEWLLTGWRDVSLPLGPLIDWLAEHHGDAAPWLWDMALAAGQSEAERV